jgi:hypothetical protein
LLQLGGDVLKYHGGAEFLMRTDLGQQPFAHLYQLRYLGRQSSKKAQLFRWKTAACFGPEGEEAGDEFGINPVGLGACATALRKRLHLSRWHLAGGYTFCLKNRPELPFLTTSRFKADDGIPVPGKIRDGCMTCWSIWQFAAMPICEAMNVKPIAADIYAPLGRLLRNRLPGNG